MDDESSVGALKCNDKCNIDGVEDTKLAAQETRSRDTRKLSTAVGFCLLFMFIEIAGGIKANSLAILTDAAHLLSDIAGFAISIFSIWASGWEANPRQTFGYYRAEILGALLSIQIIWLVTGVLVYEAIVRFIHPDTNINGKIMFIIACVGLGMNIILMITLGHHGHSHSHGGHSHSHDHGHDHEVHDHSKVGHAHNHEHEDHHKHDKAHGHHKEKPSICKRLANMFRKQKDHHGDHHQKPHEHEPHKAGNHDNEAHETVRVHIEHEDGQLQEPHHDNEVHEIHVGDHNVEQCDGPHDVGHEDHKPFLVQTDRRRSVKVDVNLATDHEAEKAEGSINVRGAYLHALGDLIQSLGVLIAGAVIWVYPNLYVIDPICTLVFSVMVLATTYNMLREVVSVLMESTPREIDASALEKGLLALTSVVAIHELHIWAITVGRSLLACHILVDPEADTQDVLHKVTEYCEKVYKISHVTIQVERDL